MGGIIIVFRPRDFINVGVVLKVKSTLGFRGLGFKGLGFRGLGFKGLGCRV